MAARSRPRAGQQRDEIDEERHLWNTIRADGKRFDQLMVRFLIFDAPHFVLSCLDISHVRLQQRKKSKLYTDIEPSTTMG